MFAARRIGAREQACAQLSVKGTDRIPRGLQAEEVREPASAACTPPCQMDRTSTCASNMNSKPRLRRQRLARPQFLSLLTDWRDIVTAAWRCWHARRARSSGCPALRGHRRRFRVPPSGVRPAPAIFLGEPNLADMPGCPNATQPEPVTVSVPSYGSRQGIGKPSVGFGVKRSEFRTSRTPSADA
jgi:hypothetical protein